jgi:hypothetical protein
MSWQSRHDAACEQQNKYVPPPPARVTFAHSVRQQITRYLEATGHTAAVNSANLVARVQGFLQEIKYRDGDLVKQGAVRRPNRSLTDPNRKAPDAPFRRRNRAGQSQFRLSLSYCISAHQLRTASPDDQVRRAARGAGRSS